MTPDRQHATSNVILVTVRQIAEWALPHDLNTQRPEPLAVLPKLQRGPAWKPEQIERLWDSIVRGFPIGSLLVSPYGIRNDLGGKDFALGGMQRRNSLWSPDPDDLHLLDGQQRVTAIALGFFNPWTNPIHREIDELRYTLWVDLDPAEGEDERVFVFRLLTRSHPWGYQRLHPGTRLSARNRLQAVTEFEQANKGRRLFAGELPIQAVPFDARAPVPVAILLECLGETNVWQALRQRLDQISPAADEGQAQGTQRLEQRNRLNALLSCNPVPCHMMRLAEGLQPLMAEEDGAFRIPALVVPRKQFSRPEIPKSEQKREDPIATLFIRINSAGTVPSQEELVYSLLKSEWPGCHELIEELPYSFLSPALMVAQFSSLILADATARTARAETKTPPAFPDLRAFRRLVHHGAPECKDFLDHLQRFLGEGRAKRVVEAAKRIMMCDQNGERPFRLLPAQGAQLARRNRRIFFLFLSWINSRLDLQGPWLGLDEAAHRRILGVITALSWFGWYEEDCVAGLWPYRAALHEPGTLARITGERDGRFHLLPLPPPSILRSAVRDRVTLTLEKADAETWDKWRFWKDFAKDPHDITEAAEWYSASAHLSLIGGEVDPVLRSNAWTNFVTKLRDERELTLYAQRATLIDWFQTYDPTSPDRLEDTDRPWDFDHILPNAFKSAFYVPPVIREWQASIGNLRAWPAELNRSDGAIKPMKKLGDPDATEDVREIGVYGLHSQVDRLNASAVTDDELGLWREACPADMHSNYLAQLENRDKRVLVLRAITGRWVRLYEAWFSDLRIAELMEGRPYNG